MSADNAPEHQIDDLEREDATLLQKTPSSAVELDGIPAVRAAGYGNWTWAEQRCCRRNGLTREQVEMVHKLSQIYKDGGDIIEFYTFLLEKLIPMAQSSLPNLASDPRHRTQSFFFRVSYALTSERSIKPLGTGRFNLDSLSAKLDQLHGMTAPDPLTLLSVSSATISALDFVNARVRIKAATQELSSFYRLLETSKQLLEFLHREMIADQALDKTQEHPGNQEQSRLSSKHAAQQAVKTGNDTKTVEPDLISLESSTKKELCRNPQDQLQQDSQTTNNPTVRHTRFRGYNYDQAKLDSLVHDLISSQLRAEDGPPQRYIVIGRFPKGSPNPIEATTNFLSNGEDLFPKIRKQARSIRGWQNYFSLKTLKRFSLYQCDIPNGAHIKPHLFRHHHSTLSQFFLAYQASYWHPDAAVSQAWGDWIHKNLNASSGFPFDGKYSLELVYGWSPTRLVFAVSIAVFLSFGVGLGYMLQTGDVSTAWTIASYVITTASAVIALVAILGSLTVG